MNDQQKNEQSSAVRDQEIHAALDQHWAVSDANDFVTEHLIYHEDAVLDYPQSCERTRGRHTASPFASARRAARIRFWKVSTSLASEPAGSVLCLPPRV
jgi:hypothetical protein